MDFQVVIYPKISKTDPNFLFKKSQKYSEEIQKKSEKIQKYPKISKFFYSKKVKKRQKGYNEILSKRWELGVWWGGV